MRILALLVCIIPLAAARTGYREALPGYSYQFPRDHFAHQDFRTEWWYYTGNVTGPGAERYGFELVFFRQGEERQLANEQDKSAWAVHDLYLAHAALTDARGKRFLYAERLNRAGPGIAGASFDRRRIWNGNWSAQWSGDNQTLDALTPDFRFHLQLMPEKPFIIHGENGVSQKAEGAGHASHYVSFTRLAVTGTIGKRAVIGTAPVNGKAWMDHEWFTEQLAADEVGWDWFSIQLENHTELMLFDLRRKDGSIDPYSSGTFVDAHGAAHHLKHEDFTLQPLSWHGKYPVAWRIRVPSLNIELTEKPVLEDQALHSKQGGTNYWEGAVDYSGTHKGAGYLEMTGYEGQVRF